MADKRRLGRGLQALIPEYSSVDQEKVDRFGEIPVDSIVTNPFQPREEFNPDALEELKQSISEMGIIQPISVRRRDDGKYELISGERRLKAVRELGYENIPAYILKVESDDEMLEMALIENIQREDLNPIDIARAYERLIQECHLTQEQVAQKVSKDRSTVTNFLRLLKLPDEIQESLRRGELSMGHARALLALEDSQQQKKIWKRVVKRNLSVRQVEKIVKELASGTGEDKPSKPTRKSAHILHVEDKFREIYGTQVRIYPRKQGGKIEIEYYTDDDLDRIYQILIKQNERY